MKAHLWIDANGDRQVVLSPESQAERESLKAYFPDDPDAYDINMFRAQFFECNGGWTRGVMYDRPQSQDDYIIRFKKKTEPSAIDGGGLQSLG